jgi:mannose-6-phosphate isomerase-like protein (cupin superfamily)
MRLGHATEEALMRIIRKDQVAPFRAPLGEEIFELIGRSDELGATVKHSLAYVVVPPGSRSPAHYHKESEETYYILDGEARLRVDGDEHHVVRGDACLIVPPEVHEIVSVGTGSLEFLVISAPAWVPTDTYEASE